MNDFNFRFQRTWDRIPAMMRPPLEYVFLYFLRALNCDIAVMIQSMGGVSLPDAFEIAIRAKNSLIQAGKLAPRPPMPIFPQIHANIPLQIPPFTPLPVVVPTIDKQEGVASSSSNELQEIKILL